MEECVDEEQQSVGTSAVECLHVEEFGNEEQHTEGTSIVEMSPVEEFGSEEHYTEGTPVMETPPVEVFSPSSSSMSVSLHHIMKPFLRHAKRKFSFSSKPVSTSD